jgi:peptidoglycan-associated lipoprotein
MRSITTLAIILSSAALFSACSSVKLDEKPKVEERAAVTPAKTDSRTVEPVTTKSMDPLDDPKGVLAKREVFFDFDSYIVKDEYKPLVEAHGKYLSGKQARKIVIQGNTDERGGREYNLALGQKRAEAVRKSLTALGVQEGQMEAVSFGKEKPRATGSDETSWATNRRSDIVYQ